MVNVGCQVFKEKVQNQIVFDRDARRSSPTIHFVGFTTLVRVSNSNFSPKLAINPWKLDV